MDYEEKEDRGKDGSIAFVAIVWRSKFHAGSFSYSNQQLGKMWEHCSQNGLPEPEDIVVVDTVISKLEFVLLIYYTHTFGYDLASLFMMSETERRICIAYVLQNV